jgi:hypothetical protein
MVALDLFIYSALNFLIISMENMISSCLLLQEQHETVKIYTQNKNEVKIYISENDQLVQSPLLLY